MTLFQFALLSNLSSINNAIRTPEQTTLSNYINSIVLKAALLFMITGFTFFKGWSFLSAVFLGLTVFSFLYGSVISANLFAPPEKLRVTASTSFIFLSFSIIACEIYLFTSMQWLFYPIFYSGIAICILYRIGIYQERKATKENINANPTKTTTKITPQSIDPEFQFQAKLLARAITAIISDKIV